MRRVPPLALAAFALALPSVAGAQAIPAGPGGELSSVVGLPFDVPFVVDMRARSEKLGAFLLRIQWNPAVLKLEDGGPGSFGSTTLNTDSLPDGVLRIAGVNPAGVSGNVTVAVARFTPLAAATTTIEFALNELFAAGTYADLRPSAVVSNGLYCPARGRFGDIDKDGNANSRDALIALSNAVGLDVSAFDIGLGDVDNNAATNARDALVILSSAVGLDVSAFRVLRLAGGTCSSNPNIAMSITPGTLELVNGQQAFLEARASGTGGVLVAVPDAVWKSSNPAVVAVTSTGQAFARSVGTAVVTASRGVSDSAQATITVVAGRTMHVVDAAALGNSNQLGSAAFPFASITAALPYADEGDTVSVKPGRYDGQVILGAGILLLGDTALDGSRPILTGGGPFLAALFLNGPGYRRVVNLAFDDVAPAIEINGPDSVSLEGLVGDRLGGAVVVSSNLGLLRVLRSRLIGRGVNSNYDLGIYAYDRLDTLVIDDSELGDFGDDGVYIFDADSVAVTRSRLHDFGRSALDLAAGYDGAQLGLWVDSSRIERADDYMIYVYDTRSIVITHSVLNNPNDEIIDQYPEYGPSTGYIVLRGDSLVTDDSDWLDLTGLDSLIIDSTTAVIPDSDGDIYDVRYIRVTDSRFLDVDYYALDVGFGTISGGRLEVYRSQFVGPADCDQCGTGIYIYDGAVVVDSSTFINLDEGVYAYGDSSLSVTRSVFRRVYDAVEWYGNYYSGCAPYCNPSAGATVQGNLFDDTQYGVEAYDGIIVVDSNTFTGGYDAIDVGASQPITITRNTITDFEDEAIESYLYDTTVTGIISDNVITNSDYVGIYADGDTYLARTRWEILRNTIQCRASSYYGGDGIDAYDSDLIIMDNVVTGCEWGIYTRNYGDSTLVDSIIGNTVSMGANYDNGIYAEGNFRIRLSRNTINSPRAGGDYYGNVWLEGNYYYRTTTALVDSNTIVGGSYRGLTANYVDTLVIANNVIDSVATGCCGSVGVYIYGGLLYFGAASGNTIRGSAEGITINHSDTTTFQVDSNLISGNGIGVQVLGYANALLTRNTITGNTQYGVASNTYGIWSLTLNNIFGNAFGVLSTTQVVSAPNNWWGDPLGPNCIECASTAGDSVDLNVSFSPPLPAPYTGAPPAAPRRPPLVARAARAAPVSASFSAAAGTDRVRRERRPDVARTARQPVSARAALTLPAGMPEASAQRIRRRWETDGVRAASSVTRDASRNQVRTTRQDGLRSRIEGRRSQVRAGRERRDAERQSAPRPVQAPRVRP